MDARTSGCTSLFVVALIGIGISFILMFPHTTNAEAWADALTNGENELRPDNYDYTLISVDSVNQQSSNAVGDDVDTTYLTGVIDIHSNSKHPNFLQGVFARGEKINFYGYVDGYSPLPDTRNATFKVTITDPKNSIVLRQDFVADKIGGQEVIGFAYQIPANASFGMYEIDFVVEKEGHKTISRHSTDPNVGYGPSRFFVSWTKEEIIDVSDKYKIEILDPIHGEPKAFGSIFDVKVRICPSPLALVANQTFYDPESKESAVSPTRAILARISLSPLEAQAENEVRNVTNFNFSTDGCNEPFTINHSGVLAASGRWGINATVEWLDMNDPNHFYSARGDPAGFDVAHTLYSTSEITPITIDSEKYQGVSLMDWSADGKSILFAYHAQNSLPGLAILHLDTHSLRNGEGLHEPQVYNVTDLGYITISKDGQPIGEDYVPYLSAARFGVGPETGSIYFVLDSGLYLHEIDSGTQSVSINSARKLLDIDYMGIDILSDGRIAYTALGRLMISSQPDAQDAKEIAKIEEDVVSFDISSDGKKVLYSNNLEASYYSGRSILKYYDLETGTEHVIPNIELDCGAGTWAPNDFNIIISDDQCWRAPGGGLAISDINGSTMDYLVPSSDDNPGNYIVSPDGGYIAIKCEGYREGQACSYLGPQADFYVMKLARPVPEFDSVPILGTAASIAAALRILRLKLRRLPKAQKGG
jgi:hypothetical protein